MVSGSATCAFFTEIGRLTGNVEDRVALGRVATQFNNQTKSPMGVVVAWACDVAMALRATTIVWSTSMT